MNCYFCIVNIPGVPGREIAALNATNDLDAREAMVRITVSWPGYETIELYRGERLIAMMANPWLGFSEEPLALVDRAA